MPQVHTTLVSWTYDAAGRMVSRTADSVTTSYAYDTLGNRLTAANSGSTITTTYDRLNRPLTVTNSADAGAGTTYTYSLTAPSWTDPSGSYSAALDAFDRQLSFHEPVHSGSWTWTYRADGGPATANSASQIGLNTTYAYDLTGQLVTKSTEKSQGHQSRATYGYTRNRAGLILTESSVISSDPTSGQTASYTYDPLDRLGTYQLGTGSTTTYGWQAVPNRSSVAVGNGTPVTTAFDLANRPTSASDGSAYTSDSEGRLTARPGQVLYWDSLGRLTEVRASGTNALIAGYTYDALDRLLTADNGTLRIRFRYAGLTAAVAQTVNDSTSAVIRSIANDWAGQRLLDWTGSSSNVRVYGTNLHGDVTWFGSDAAAVIATVRYDPWGTLVNSWTSSGISLPDFRFRREQMWDTTRSKN